MVFTLDKPTDSIVKQQRIRLCKRNAARFVAFSHHPHTTRKRVLVRYRCVKLIPTEDEILECRAFGLELAQELMGKRENRSVNLSDLS